jgi:hypothetical protein
MINTTNETCPLLLLLLLLIDPSASVDARMSSTSYRVKNKFAYAIPHTPCEEFYDELLYAKNEVKIRRIYR